MYQFEYEQDRSRHMYAAVLLDMIEIRHRCDGSDCRPCADLRSALVGWIKKHVEGVAVPIRLVG